jgi:hypothetical protein
MRCAERSLQDEPLGGTAPEARGFLLVEHDGPWAAKAPAAAGLAETEARAKPLGVKVLLVRRADRTPAAGRAFAVSCAGEPWTAAVDPAALDGALAALAAGERPVSADAGRLWLVCTNGKRDACCARDGLPVARALAELRPDETWECTHLGGHRFAANVALLPDGLCFGRVAAVSVPALVDAVERGAPPLELLRGRMALSPPAQAAELAARAAGAVTGLAQPPLELDGATATVAGIRFELTAQELPPRPVSCDAEPEPVEVWHARVVAPA